ncbi:NAD(P)-dependent dehydrogenase (short-subunit alcohol dehydrogenase family) [Bradyrhizobium sp. SBR1B]|nr:NAD(P)-dependent dehydrogenase (short-subunit alcohol dehydrogenase family) [Bradyrhizobium sp. SBR1B]
MLLSGKTAIISGAASPRGIGLATARRFAAEGARCAILDIDADAAADAAASLGKSHVGLRCDVADKASCEQAVARALDAFGSVDILINNAGITQPVKLLEISAADWDRIQDVNLKGVLFRNFWRSALFGGEGRRAGSRQGYGPRVRPRRHPGQLRDARPDRHRYHRRQADRR